MKNLYLQLYSTEYVQLWTHLEYIYTQIQYILTTYLCISITRIFILYMYMSMYDYTYTHSERIYQSVNPHAHKHCLILKRSL